MELRAHHGLCISHFVGEGYDSAFIENMKKTIQEFTAGTEITVVVRPDQVCARCPHNESGICTSEEKVQHYDRAVLKLCGLKPGAQLCYGEYASLVRQRIISAGRLGEVCGGCQWYSLCLAVERGSR